jgi:hypothetical protein
MHAPSSSDSIPHFRSNNALARIIHGTLEEGEPARIRSGCSKTDRMRRLPWWKILPQPQCSSKPPHRSPFRPLSATSHDGCSIASITFAYAPGLGVQICPASDSYRAVVVAVAAVLTSGLRPTRGVFEVELLAVAVWTAHRSRRGRFGFGVEDPIGVESHHDLRGASFQVALELHRIIASIEDEDGHIFELG